MAHSAAGGRIMCVARPLFPGVLLIFAGTVSAATVEFCLDGQFDLAARLQGTGPAGGEFGEARWCVTTEDGGDRVLFRGSGKSNPDMSGAFEVAFLPPDTVRIVNRETPPDVEFRGADIGAEARRYRRIDPQRFVEELARYPGLTGTAGDDGWQSIRYPGSSQAVLARIDDGVLRSVRTTADLPLRGRVEVEWVWGEAGPDGQDFELVVDGVTTFRGKATRRILPEDAATALWERSGNQDPHEVPGDAWPARIDMQLDTLAEGVHLVKGVRTGFHHIVIETAEGLVIGDAPAGWVELQQLPPADLVPGLGISGLSERFVDFLDARFPGTPLRAVALTHIHDDHAGGARAFAAAGATVYAPAGISSFLQTALNREEMPDDRLSDVGGVVQVVPVADRLVLEDEKRPVAIVNIGAGPHVAESLGVLVGEPGFFYQSDLHVPRSDSDLPREDRLATECWFAGWAVDNLPGDTIVVNSHRDIHTPVSRLARYLDSDGCRSR